MKSRADLLFQNQKLEVGLGSVESFNMSVFFAIFLKELWQSFFMSGAGQFVLFPLMAFCNVMRVILAWRQAYLDRGQCSSLLRAGVETTVILAGAVAVVGGVFAASAFSLAAPIIFVASSALKSIYHFSTAIHCWRESRKAHSAAQKQQYQLMAIGNLVSGTVTALSSLAIGLVMIALKPLWAIAGIVGGVIGLGYSAYNIYQIARKPKVVLPKIASASFRYEPNKIVNQTDIRKELMSHLKVTPSIPIPTRQSIYNRGSVAGSSIVYGAPPDEEYHSMGLNQETGESSLGHDSPSNKRLLRVKRSKTFFSRNLELRTYPSQSQYELNLRSPAREGASVEAQSSPPQSPEAMNPHSPARIGFPSGDQFSLSQSPEEINLHSPARRGSLSGGQSPLSLVSLSPDVFADPDQPVPIRAQLSLDIDSDSPLVDLPSPMFFSGRKGISLPRESDDFLEASLSPNSLP